MDCQIALIQNNPTLGDLRANLALHVAEIEAALREGAQLVAFPELSLTGYFLKDQTYELGSALDAPLLAPLYELSRRASIAFGLVERGPEGRLYNSYAFLEDGRLIGVHRKVHLVTYGMFDESRDFAAGESFAAIDSKHGRFGVLICEDMWHLGGTYLHFMADVDALLVPSASPARDVQAPGPGLGSVRVWKTLLAATSLFTQTWVLYANRVGFEDGIAFSGASCVHDPFGAELCALEGFDTGRLRAHVRSAELVRARALTPLRRDEKPRMLLAGLERALGVERGRDVERALDAQPRGGSAS